jgi:hypothetical protein
MTRPRALSIAGALTALAIVFLAAACGREKSPTAPSGGDQRKLAILEEILRSKNDNDPRLDREFNDLSQAAKRLLEDRYRAIPPERRNERGTIVFLLGKNIGSAEDWAFMREAASEPPCLSLSDCSRRPTPGGGEEAAGDEVTLAYPSLVALKQAQRALETAGAISTSGTTAKDALSVIEAGRKSRVRAVAKLAERLERRFARP